MREWSRKIVVLCAVLCILQVTVLAGLAANVTVSTHVTVVTDTDVVPPPTGSGGSGDTSGGGMTAPPADAVESEGASVRETGSSENSLPAAPQKGSGLLDGNLTYLACEEEAVVGNVLRIAGIFRNPGPTDTNATLVGNVFRNGAFIEVIGGEMQTVRGGTEANLSMNLTLREPGNYLVRAHVVYGGKMTPISEVSFPVKDRGTMPFLFPFVGAVLLGVVYAAVRWQRRNS